MTPEQSHRLLGGYAADALSARQRRLLLKAALEDRELLKAIQNEDALRELLPDAASRDQLREALGIPKRNIRRAGFGSRRWFLGVVLPAAVAVFLIAMMYRDAPSLLNPGTAKRMSLTPALAAQAPLYEGPLVRYSVVPSAPATEEIRIEVVSEIAGGLALYEASAAGKWQRVYPDGDAAVPVIPGHPIQIPIAKTSRPLRLLVAPATGARPPMAVDIRFAPR